MAIERNLAAIALQWLAQPAIPTTPPPPPAQPVEPTDTAQPQPQPLPEQQVGSSNRYVVNASKTMLKARRTSVSTCSNMFDIDGRVEETGLSNTQLYPVRRGNIIIGPSRSSGKHNVFIVICAFFHFICIFQRACTASTNGN